MARNLIKNNVNYGRTSVYNVNYHIVFSTKYRRKVLGAEVETVFKEELAKIAKENDFTFSAVEVGELDHVHIFVSAKPKSRPSDIVKAIKGVTARRLFERCPSIKQYLWGGHLWNPSYYIETIGHISEETVKKYINDQQKEPKDSTKQ
jgi:putative transposase